MLRSRHLIRPRDRATKKPKRERLGFRYWWSSKDRLVMVERFRLALDRINVREVGFSAVLPNTLRHAA